MSYNVIVQATYNIPLLQFSSSRQHLRSLGGLFTTQLVLAGGVDDLLFKKPLGLDDEGVSAGGMVVVSSDSSCSFLFRKDKLSKKTDVRQLIRKSS